MKSHAKTFCCGLLGWLIIMLPAAVRAESPVPLYDKTKKLLWQIHDLELMQRNAEECYRAEKRTSMTACSSRQGWTDHAELDGTLMNPVFGHLAGTSEYERFSMAYRRLTRLPDYRRLHTDELLAEYMRLLQSGRTRLMTQWKHLQESVTENGADQLQGGLPQAVQKVPTESPELMKKNESRRVGPIKREGVQLPGSGSTTLAVGGKSVSRIVVHGMNHSGSTSAAALTFDTVEPNILVAQ
jgi:hypothetical protein